MNIVRLSDPADSRLDDYRSLTDVALRRVSEPAGGLYIAESPKVIERALAAGHTPRSLLVQERWVAHLTQVVAERETTLFVLPDAAVEEVTGFAVHRGALASMQRPALPAVTDIVQDAALVLILEDVGDHANVGAAFRAAAALGADAVLVSPRCGDPLYRRSVRVSMGTVFQVPWTRFESWDDVTAELHGASIELAALALTREAIGLDAYAAARPQRVALMMGAEGEGLSDEALAVADAVVTIPMRGGVDSLNVAAAAAIALWELRP